MASLILGGRRKGVVVFVVVAGLVVLCTAALTGAFAGTSNPAQTNAAKQKFAQHLLKTGAAQLMTWPAQAFLRIQATGDRQLSPALTGRPALPSGTAGGAAAPAVPSANLKNIRVNNPSLDTHQLDQTTQSETAIAVAGSHVAVGYNDSQQSGLFLTAGSSITGYSYSADGGAHFTDGGALPNTPEFVNLGDPWLASNRGGDMYFSNLAFDIFNLNGDVAVAKSADGGKTWGTPVPVFRPPFNILYFGDKPAVATGPDPAVTSRDNVYVAYDDFSVDLNQR